VNWQRSFIRSCLIQLVMEVVIYATIEVAILQFLLPNSARADVKAVFAHLLRMIEQLCGSADRMVPAIALNAANYFFVSVRLAASYSGLPESIIISGFRSPLSPRSLFVLITPGPIYRDQMARSGTTPSSSHTKGAAAEVTRHPFFSSDSDTLLPLCLSVCLSFCLLAFSLQLSPPEPLHHTGSHLQNKPPVVRLRLSSDPAHRAAYSPAGGVGRSRHCCGQTVRPATGLRPFIPLRSRRPPPRTRSHDSLPAHSHPRDQLR
jgi:hypothetical protein